AEANSCDAIFSPAILSSSISLLFFLGFVESELLPSLEDLYLSKSKVARVQPSTAAFKWSAGVPCVPPREVAGDFLLRETAAPFLAVLAACSCFGLSV